MSFWRMCEVVDIISAHPCNWSHRCYNMFVIYIYIYIYIYIEWIDYSTKLTVQHALHQTIWNMTKLDLIILY